jgi:hypothetical protein
MEHHDSRLYDALMPPKRTTVTLDPDVAAKLKEEMRMRDISFKEALNSSIRRGLDKGGSPPPRPYKVRTAKMGARPGVNLDKALQLAGELEDQEILRKMALRK